MGVAGSGHRGVHAAPTGRGGEAIADVSDSPITALIPPAGHTGPGATRLGPSLRAPPQVRCPNNHDSVLVQLWNTSPRPSPRTSTSVGRPARRERCRKSVPQLSNCGTLVHPTARSRSRRARREPDRRRLISPAAASRAAWAHTQAPAGDAPRPSAECSKLDTRGMPRAARSVTKRQSRKNRGNWACKGVAALYNQHCSSRQGWAALLPSPSRALFPHLLPHRARAWHG